MKLGCRTPTDTYQNKIFEVPEKLLHCRRSADFERALFQHPVQHTGEIYITTEQIRIRIIVLQK